MASEDKRANNNKLEITVLNTAVNKNGQLLEDITYGRSVLEYGLENEYINIALENNGIDKDGNRFDLDTKRVISIKGKKEKPKGSKKARLDERDDNEIA